MYGVEYVEYPLKSKDIKNSVNVIEDKKMS